MMLVSGTERNENHVPLTTTNNVRNDDIYVEMKTESMTIYIHLVRNKLSQKEKMKDMQRVLSWKMFLILQLEKAESLFQNVITRTITLQRLLTVISHQLPIRTMAFATCQAK